VVRGQAALGIVYSWLPTWASPISVISIAASLPQSEAISLNYRDQQSAVRLICQAMVHAVWIRRCA